MRKKEREGRGKGTERRGREQRDGRESLGVEGGEGKGVGKMGGEGKFRGGPGPPNIFS